MFIIYITRIYNFIYYIGHCSGNICQHGALRIINGTTSNEGRLEICIYSVWGTVCDDSFDTNDARVACRQLRYEVDNGQSKLHYNTNFQCMIAVTYYNSAHFGQGTGPIWITQLYCTGTEQNILKCPRQFELGNPLGCSHSEDVSVVCPGNVSFVTRFVIYFM